MFSIVYLRGGGTTGAIYHIYSDIKFARHQYMINAGVVGENDVPYIGLTSGTIYAQHPATNPQYTWKVREPLTTPNTTHLNELYTAQRAANIESTVSTHTTQLQQHDTAISAKANASDVYTKTQTDGLISTEVTNRNAAITASANAINSSVSANYTLKTTTEALDGRVTENTTALEDKADAKDVYSKEQIDNSITEITAAYQSEINEAADQITQSVSETYADKDSIKDLNTLITETASSWNLQITDLSAALNDAVDSLGITDADLKELTTYVHIENEGSSPCLSLGSSESNITAALLNNRLEFRVKGSSTPVAYIEVDEDTHVGKLYITSAVVTSEMQFGYWKWFARGNDNLALKWIGA
jgi:ACT domain-containing protein